MAMATPKFDDTVLHGGLPCMVGGSGPPLVVLPGLSAEHRNPIGFDRWMQLGPVSTLARRFRVHVINRRPGLDPGTAMRDLATDVAAALRHEFDEPVAVEGISTGGSIAQQLAVDHPEVVRRLVLVCAACRLGPEGRENQRHLAALTEAGRPRAAWASVGPMLTSNWVSGRFMAAIMWLVGASIDPDDPTDMVTTIGAEDRFDLCRELHRISAPTLIVAGGRDRTYSTELFEWTARNIPDARLVLYPYRGHAGIIAQSATQDHILRFLTADLPAEASRPRPQRQARG
jgi:pimeloyl-ACP methyl ester carboxylesterase